MLDMSELPWKPAIVSTVATKNEGIDGLWAAIEKHRAYQEENGLLQDRRRRRIEREIREIVAERLRRRVETEKTELLRRVTDEVVKRERNPYQAADEIISAL